MACFSRLDCVTGEQIRIGSQRKIYVLFPKEYGGGHYIAERYDGNGNYSSIKINELIADWNKHMIPEILHLVDAGEWEFSATANDKKVLQNFYEDKPLEEGLTEGVFCHGTDKKEVGNIMCCFDKDNARLDFPVKVTYCGDAIYEHWNPSKRDPNQGSD
jgi:hypothetical protein